MQSTSSASSEPVHTEQEAEINNTEDRPVLAPYRLCQFPANVQRLHDKTDHQFITMHVALRCGYIHFWVTRSIALMCWIWKYIQMCKQCIYRIASLCNLVIYLLWSFIWIWQKSEAELVHCQVVLQKQVHITCRMQTVSRKLGWCPYWNQTLAVRGLFFEVVSSNWMH